MAVSTISSEINDSAGGSIANVRVVARLLPRPAFETATGITLAATLEATSDAAGQYSFVLTETASITPSGSYYEIIEYVPDRYGGPVKHTIQVGAANTTVYASLVSVPPTPGSATYLTQTSADARYVQSPGSFAVVGNIAESKPVTVAAAGVLTTYARGDHAHKREVLYGTDAVRLALTGTDLYEGLRYHATDTDLFWQYINSAWTQVTTTWINTAANKPAVATAGQSIYITDATNITGTGIYTPNTGSQPARVGNVWWHNGTRWQYGEWGKPWGIAGYVEGVTAQTGLSAITDLTTMTITFTAAANRRYMIQGQCRVAKQTAVGVVTLTLRDSTPTVYQEHSAALDITNISAETLHIHKLLTPAAGSITLKLSLACTAGTVDTICGATRPITLSIIDVGPNGAPA